MLRSGGAAWPMHSIASYSGKKYKGVIIDVEHVGGPPSQVGEVLWRDGEDEHRALDSVAEGLQRAEVE